MANQKLKIFAGGDGNCSGGTCPTVYKSDDGKFYVQGYVVPAEINSQVRLDSNEMLVEVSPQLIANIAKQLA